MCNDIYKEPEKNSRGVPGIFLEETKTDIYK